MKAGNYNEVITFLVPELSKNEFGEKVQEYTPLYTTRAFVAYDTGSRFIVNSEVFNQYSKTFTVHDYLEINEKMLILYDDKKWIINAINHLKPTKELVISTTLYNE